MKYCLTLILLFALLSCFNKKDNIEIIQLDNAIDYTVSVDLNKLTDSIRYIRLETNDRCLVTRIDKIELIDGFLFVKDQRNVLYVFNLNGDYLYTIGGMGNGPGEYIVLHDFYIDKHNNRVEIFDQVQSKVIEYGYDGKFINEFRVICCPDRVKKIWNNYYFSSTFMGIDTLIYEYIDNQIVNHYTKKDLCLEQFKEHVLHFQALSTFGDSITYWNELNNYVFRIIDGKLLKRFLFDFGKHSYQIKTNEQASGNFNDRSEHGSIESFIETKNYIFINSIFKNKVKHILYDKSTKETSVIDNQLCKTNTLFNNLSFVNSFDGLVNFWPDKNGIINDSLLYRTFYAYNLKNSNFCNPEGKKISYKSSTIQKIIDESSYSDNPIIMIVTLRQ
jgi:hypothetical protein